MNHVTESPGSIKAKKQLRSRAISKNEPKSDCQLELWALSGLDPSDNAIVTFKDVRRLTHYALSPWFGADSRLPSKTAWKWKSGWWIYQKRLHDYVTKVIQPTKNRITPHLSCFTIWHGWFGQGMSRITPFSWGICWRSIDVAVATAAIPVHWVWLWDHPAKIESGMFG
jgi:hypothetical protein